MVVVVALFDISRAVCRIHPCCLQQISVHWSVGEITSPKYFPVI